MSQRCTAIFVAAAISTASLTGAGSTLAKDEAITVFAAASLKNAIDEIGASYTKDTGVRVIASYGASSQLMRQIEQGAPADIFLSADLDWMDYGRQKKLINDASRVNLLGNRLVLVAPKDSTISEVFLEPYVDLERLIGDERMVMGNVQAVPAGRYAKSALESLGIWARVERRIAMVENVRAALALVARREAPLGIVYATDAKVEPNVKVVGIFPEESHPSIVYPAALIMAAKPAAPRFLRYLRSSAAKAVFERYGFTFLADSSS